ncbi:MAG TPA: NAD(P)/FAD-dependent oxidoreductase [Chitinophagaceae bacterium]|jgi:Dehydrogenases (flavoproteins)
MNIETKNTEANGLYDAAIIGGGLAGLSLSIQLAKQGYKVLLMEKEVYPFHKVCGEYISLESWDFLETLGVPLSEMNLPIIHKLFISAPNGNYLEHMLPLGGFGISRFKIDAMLASIARNCGVHIYEQTKVNEVKMEKDSFTLECSAGKFKSKLVAGAYGKRSNLDIRYKRKFITRRPNKLNHFIGVKYHIEIDHPADLIALHNFENGYCGISKVEENKYCLCYLTTAQNLNKCDKDISRLEKEILSQNPFLKTIFENAKFLNSTPHIISQVSFEKKTQVENHILMTGDAAGMITPLCGNGMSMALYAGKLLAGQMHAFLQNKISRTEMEENYKQAWKAAFKKRLFTGRIIQRLFGSTILSDWLISFVKPFPALVNKLISATHGNPF